jgi:short-subunit dehydrogenase
MKKIFLTGASSGIGLACYDLLSHEYNITAPSKEEFNLQNFAAIDQLDLSMFDIVLNCAGINVGTYLGFQNNSYTNQVDQTQINFIAPLLLAKQYTKTRENGHFVYVSSASVDSPQLYNIFNASSKKALSYSIDILRDNFTNFIFSEICPGKTKTNMLKKNYNGTKTNAEVDAEYELHPYLLASDVANTIKYAINQKITKIKLLPTCLK